MKIRQLYWDIVIHFDKDLTLYQREMLLNKLRAGMPNAIHRDKNVTGGDNMKKYYKVTVSNKVILEGAVMTENMLKQFKALVPSIQVIEVSVDSVESWHVITNMADFTGEGERNEFYLLNGETVS